MAMSLSHDCLQVLLLATAFVDLFLLALDELVNDRIEEDATNTDGTSKELHGIQALTQDKSNADDNNHTLGSVGNGLSNRRGLLKGHGRQLIVAVVPESRGNQIHLDSGRIFEDINKLAQSAALLEEYKGDREEEAKDAGKGKLVADRSHTIFEALSLHELLVLIATDGSEKIGNASRYQGGNRKVKLVDRSENNTTDDDGEAQPLGLAHALAINELRENGSKGRLGGLDNLSKGNTTGRERKHRSTVGAGIAEGEREHLDDVIHCHLGGLSGIRGDPKEETIEASNSQLKGGDGHGKASSSTRSLQGALVGKIVL